MRKPRGVFAVIAGGRRLRVLTMLAERGDIDPSEFEVPVIVLVGDDTILSEASLAENFQHLAMSPADECRAFQHFLAGNDDIDGVTKRFGVTRRSSRAVCGSPSWPSRSLLRLHRERSRSTWPRPMPRPKATTSRCSCETSMGIAAYATADTIRRSIANEAMSSTDPVALLVGADAYVAAGGTIDRDLFSDNADRWLAPEIAQNLAGAIMETGATRIGAEQGWRGSGRSPGPAPGKRHGTCFASRYPKRLSMNSKPPGSMQSVTGSTSSRPRWKTRTCPKRPIPRLLMRSKRSRPSEARSANGLGSCRQN